MKMVTGLKMQVLKLNLLLVLIVCSFGVQSKTLKVDEITPSVTNGDLSLTPNGTGDIIFGSLDGRPLLTSGVLSVAVLNVESEITGTLAIGNGGTNSSTALNNNFVMISSGGAIVEDANVTTTELGYLDGVTSSLQTQIDSKESSITTLPISKGGTNSSAALSNSFVMESVGGAIVESTTTSTELSYLDATSSIQTQLDGKEPTITILPIVNGGTGSSTKNFVDFTTDQTVGGVKNFSSELLMDQLTTPSNPAASKNKLYFKSDNNLYKLTAGGVETQVGGVTTVDLTSDVTGVLPIANGGTNGSTATSGFNNLSPVTTKGDIIVRDSTNNIRLAVGTNDQVLTADSGETSGVKWADRSPTTSYTPTFTSFGTVTGVGFEYVVNGKFMTIWGKFATGTVVAAEARVSLPSGFTVSSTIGNIFVVGSWIRNTAAADTFYPVVTGGNTYINLTSQQAGTPYSNQNGNAVGSSETQTLFAVIPLD